MKAPKQTWHRGLKLTVRELKALPDGTVVWHTYRKGDEPDLRIDEAFVIASKSEDEWEMEAVADPNDQYGFVNSEDNLDRHAEDNACQTGEAFIYRALPGKAPKPVPTATERETALKVIRYYLPQARKLAKTTDQERPVRWSDGLEAVAGLLKGDPTETFNDYLAEYKAGH